MSRPARPRPPTDRSAAPVISVWRDRDLVLFIAARVVAVAGTAVTTVAMPLLVYQLSGSVFLTALVTAGQVVPYLVFGLLAGAMADRLSRRATMVSAQLASAAALLTIPAASSTDLLSTAQALTVVLVMATAFVWFDAAAFGALPALAGRGRIVAANSAVWTATTLVGIGGPALGGLLVAVVGPARALAVDAAAYLVAAGLVLALRQSIAPPRATAGQPRARIRDGVAEGLRFIQTHRLVRDLTLLGVGNSLVGGAVTGLLVAITVDQLDLSTEGRGLGLMLAVVALGGFCGAAALPALSRRLPPGILALAALALGVPAVLGLAVAPSLAAALPLLMLWSISTTVILNGISARQQATPDHLQARVNTTARMVAWGGTPLGALAAGALAQGAGVTAALILTAATLFATVVIGTISGLGTRAVEDPGAAR